MFNFRGFLIFLGFFILLGTFLEGYRFYYSRNGNSECVLLGNDNGFIKLILGFGLYGNFSKWLDTNIPKGSGHLGCLDGIRFLSMSWVVLCHSWPEFQNLVKFPLRVIMVCSWVGSDSVFKNHCFRVCILQFTLSIN